jgi:hypothetical protein
MINLNRQTAGFAYEVRQRSQVQACFGKCGQESVGQLMILAQGKQAPVQLLPVPDRRLRFAAVQWGNLLRILITVHFYQSNKGRRVRIVRRPQAIAQKIVESRIPSPYSRQKPSPRQMQPCDPCNPCCVQCQIEPLEHNRLLQIARPPQFIVQVLRLSQ